jgi:hypothetical protein
LGGSPRYVSEDHSLITRRLIGCCVCTFPFPTAWLSSGITPLMRRTSARIVALDQLRSSLMLRWLRGEQRSSRQAVQCCHAAPSLACHSLALQISRSYPPTLLLLFECTFSSRNISQVASYLCEPRLSSDQKSLGRLNQPQRF